MLYGDSASKKLTHFGRDTAFFKPLDVQISRGSLDRSRHNLLAMAMVCQGLLTIFASGGKSWLKTSNSPPR